MATTKLLIATCLTCSVVLSCTPANDKDGAVSDGSARPDSTTGPAQATNGEDWTEPANEQGAAAEAPLLSLAELGRRLTKNASHFAIQASRDTVLRCKEGTLLAVPANAFMNASRPNDPVTEVKITVREFYRLADMVTAGLSTRSNGHLLETGGMLNIRVSGKENNDSCILKPGKEISIAMPSTDSSRVAGMLLFNGTHEDSAINWTPRNGPGGLALPWGSRRRGLPANLTDTRGFVFPDGLPREKPHMVRSRSEDLQVESRLSLRNLMHHPGTFTKKVNVYIDTTGSVHCYNIGDGFPGVTFRDLFSPSRSQDMKVNIAATAIISYEAVVNRDHYQKLFKLGKGNPDSLVTVTVHLNPALRFTGPEKIKTVFRSAITVREYRLLEKQRSRLREEYLKKIELLRLEREESMARAESSGTGSDLRSAEDYLLLSTPKLGWINCDRFYSYPEKTDYFVKLEEPASLLIVFNSVRAILSSHNNGLFQNLPLNEKITIIGLRAENGKLMMAMHETTVSRQPFEALRFEPVSLKEYKTRLEKLNRL